MLNFSSSGGAELDILKIFRISEPELRRLVEAPHNVLKIFMERRIGKEA